MKCAGFSVEDYGGEMQNDYSRYMRGMKRYNFWEELRRKSRKIYVNESFKYET